MTKDFHLVILLLILLPFDIFTFNFSSQSSPFLMCLQQFGHVTHLQHMLQPHSAQ